MFSASLWESVGAFLTILTPLVAVPLTVITFYLRSLREHQVSWHAELVRRLDAADRSIAELRKTLSEFERDFTTKEEWLRQCMQDRRTLEQVTEATIRLETTVKNIIPVMDESSGAGRAPESTAARVPAAIGGFKKDDD